MDDRAGWAMRGGWAVGCVLALHLVYQLRGLLILIVLVAGQVLGVWGILFAVPAAAVLRVLIPELWALAYQKRVQA